MYKTLNSLALAILLLATSRVCRAEWVIEHVSAERAKELGATFVVDAKGADSTKMTLSFKPEGALKDFSHVELRITSDTKALVSAPLQVVRKGAGPASVSFSAHASQLPNSSLTIFVPGGLGGEGYEFKVKDFVEPAKAGGKRSE